MTVIRHLGEPGVAAGVVQKGGRATSCSPADEEPHDRAARGQLRCRWSVTHGLQPGWYQAARRRRSEERRVGKEGRFGGVPEYEVKNVDARLATRARRYTYYK